MAAPSAGGRSAASSVSTDEMCVIKRDGKLQEVAFDKILNRVKTLGKEGNISINFSSLCLKVIDQLYNKIPTSKIDELTAEQCASMITTHYHYGELAARISVSNLHKNTGADFGETMKREHDAGILSDAVWAMIENHRDRLQSVIDYERDYLLDYFGFKTLERAYLMRVNGVIVERPQHMWLRVACGIHQTDVEQAIETYHLMSQLFFTHATPTLFNSGTLRPQLSSCFLLTTKDDSIDGIFDTVKNCALISKWAGGIGLDVSKIRATGTHIKGTNGYSNGLIPMLRVFNSTARYVDQGGGKRQGSFAIYLEPHHPDIEDFLELRKNHGDEELKARDLFYGLWISDHFMRCVSEDADWYLFCPHQTPGLAEVYGDDYVDLYTRLVEEGNWVKKVRARELWFKILDSQMETGTPYLLFKDHCNNKSNQKNLGVIKSSNLCTEIVEYTSPEETAVCNLASISLSKFVKEDKSYDYDGLHRIAKVVTRNLNKVIDVNYYPIPETRLSNLLHRPIGIGVQGLADAFFKMDIAFESEAAKQVNKLIFETIYHAAVETSNELAIERGAALRTLRTAIDNDRLDFADKTDKVCQEFLVGDGEGGFGEGELPALYAELVARYRPTQYEMNNLAEACLGAYSTFTDSPMSKGEFQFDMWNVIPSERYDWDTLRESVMVHGLRNSLLVAPMPTASTSQILGNNEAFEPITSNIYSRRTNAGEFTIVNKHLIKELIELGLWNESLKNNIIKNRGSIQQVTNLSDHIKQKYKIVWEMPMKHLVEMAADRGAFICQSQSLNLWLEEPNYNTLTSMHFYSWKQGLKTGIYYLRRKPKHTAQQFTIEPDEAPACEMCSG